ncbi:MAG TPA: glycosyltransferase family 9 protein [Solirubrobacterales bacterium]|nr:glycosyltransferase family 9 protein [Solirubrobacterales bacterium]
MAVTVLRALGLGDLLTAVPALRGIARAFPEQRRVLAAPGWLEPLLPLIREAGEPCLHGLVGIAGLEADPERLPREPAVAVNLHGAGPQSHRLLLATGPGRLIAFRNDAVAETTAMPEWDPEEHEASRWCRLLGRFGIEADPGELEIERPEVELPAWAEGATLIHPGAASASRRWPPERWAEIARHEREQGREVLVTGSRKEIGLARWIAAEAGLDPGHEIVGRTDVRTLAAFLVAAEVLVCGDTGVAHLATALSVPSVLLFGPTSPRQWGPPDQRPIHRVLWEGRIGDPHGEEVDPGLLEIETDAVLAQLRALRPAFTG